MNKLQQKMNKRIGLNALNTKDTSTYGRMGTIENVKIKETIDNLLKVYYLINYGSFKVLSPEEDTVIFINK